MGSQNSSQVIETDKRENKSQDETKRPIGRAGEDQEAASVDQALIRGVVEYFRLVPAGKVMRKLDEWTRSRIRICLWKQWKRPRTRIKHLRQLSKSGTGIYVSNSSWGYCRMVHTQLLGTMITNCYLQSLGYVGFYNHCHWKTTHQ